MRTNTRTERQGSLFPALDNPADTDTAQDDPGKKSGRWRMPGAEGHTVAQVRLRWARRLTPGQIARIEAEIGALPTRLTKLGYGRVVLERAFVRRRKG